MVVRPSARGVYVTQEALAKSLHRQIECCLWPHPKDDAQREADARAHDDQARAIIVRLLREMQA